MKPKVSTSHTLSKKNIKVSTSHGFDAELSHLTRFSVHAPKDLKTTRSVLTCFFITKAKFALINHWTPVAIEIKKTRSTLLEKHSHQIL